MTLIIYSLFALTLIAALAVVTLRNVFHAALALALTLLAIAAIYVCLQAEFIALVQVLLYVGGIMTLILFAVMLTARISDKAVRAVNRQVSLSFVVMAAFASFVIYLIVKTPWPQAADPNTMVTAGQLGAALTGPFVFPFEVASVILIAALIGAVVIGRSE